MSTSIRGACKVKSLVKTSSAVTLADIFNKFFSKKSINSKKLLSFTGNSIGSIGVSEVCHGVTSLFAVGNAIKSCLHIHQVRLNAVSHLRGLSSIKVMVGFAMWAGVFASLKLTNRRLADIATSWAGEIYSGAFDVHCLASGVFV